jgi:hypothetical protein
MIWKRDLGGCKGNVDLAGFKGFEGEDSSTKIHKEYFYSSY